MWNAVYQLTTHLAYIKQGIKKKVILSLYHMLEPDVRPMEMNLVAVSDHIWHTVSAV